MKKLLFTLCISICIYKANAQQWNGPNTIGDKISRTGNVSLGTGLYPDEKLEIKGNVKFKGLANDGYSIKGDITRGVLRMYTHNDGTLGPIIEMYGYQHSSRPGLLALGNHGDNNHGETWFTHYNTQTASYQVQARITPTGQFIIGDGLQAVGDYNLFVDRGIMTEQIKVAIKTTNDWSDYVFKPSYKLMPLKNVEKYIAENQHLPNVPSAEDVVKGGINLGKMDATLLQKIEELMLYTIELNKQVETLQQKVVTLELKK